MFAVVSGQLVRSGKPPAATFPAANIRLLACVSPVVGLQVARLGVSLVASVIAACVDGDFLCPVPFFSTSLFQWNWRWGGGFY